MKTFLIRFFSWKTENKRFFLERVVTFLRFSDCHVDLLRSLFWRKSWSCTQKHTWIYPKLDFSRLHLYHKAVALQTLSPESSSAFILLSAEQGAQERWWSGRPLVGGLQALFPSCQHTCECIIGQDTEPQIEMLLWLKGWCQCSAVKLFSVWMCSGVNRTVTVEHFGP